jgi:hypoxanthine phosphoribosyltransferase
VDATDMGADLKEVLITPERLQARVAELAAQIDADYAGRDLLLVGVLKGAVMVLADLARAMHLPVEMDWMAVSSYGSGTKSSGVVRILKDLDNDITGRHVLVVEDIVDSGLTLSWLVGNLKSRDPASVRVCVMLRKPDAARTDVDVAYVGFDIGDEFVIGYGLDYAERYRNLPFIGTLAPHIYGGSSPRAGTAGGSGPSGSGGVPRKGAASPRAGTAGGSGGSQASSPRGGTWVGARQGEQNAR